MLQVFVPPSSDLLIPLHSRHTHHLCQHKPPPLSVVIRVRILGSHVLVLIPLAQGIKLPMLHQFKHKSHNFYSENARPKAFRNASFPCRYSQAPSPFKHSPTTLKPYNPTLLGNPQLVGGQHRIRQSAKTPFPLHFN